MAHNQHCICVQMVGLEELYQYILAKVDKLLQMIYVQLIFPSPDQPYNQFMCGYNEQPLYGIDNKIIIDHFQLRQRRGVPIQQKQSGAYSPLTL